MITKFERDYKIDENGERYFVVRELGKFAADPDATPDNLCIALDTETTGLDTSKAKLLEVSMVPFYCDNMGRIARVLEPIHMFNDPGVKIPAEITKVTGLTDADVQGHYADPKKLDIILSRVKLVVAHNARFDFRVLRTHGCKAVVPWLCTVKDVDWSAVGIGSAKLDYIAFRLGFFYEAHRSAADTAALVQILSSEMPDGFTVLRHAFSGLSPTLRIKAVGAPFADKDKLKANGYYWVDKVWTKEVTANLEEEKRWINQEIGGDPVFQKLDASNRFE